MPTILGIESTAHTFGIGIVKNGKILANVRSMYTTESGGIIPMESAKHHKEVAQEIYLKALEESGVDEKDINAVAFSQGPGLAPCLIEGMKFTKKISSKLNTLKGTSKPIIGVNHCIAHLEIGEITGAKDPVMLYASGANTQIIAYASGKFRVFGETLDLGVGNFIDTFARYAGIGFPGGPKIQKLAEQSKNYIELPYKVKGMDVAFSGILTNLKQKLEKIHSPLAHDLMVSSRTLSRLSTKNKVNEENFLVNKSLSKKAVDILTNSPRRNLSGSKISELHQSSRQRANSKKINYTLEDLAFSLQETVFAMLVETAERALAHTGKKELLLGGGVACNSRLQEMCKIMCKERGAKFFCPERSLLVDNAAMIAYLGEIMFKKKIYEKDIKKIDILSRQRTDDVKVSWR